MYSDFSFLKVRLKNNSGLCISACVCAASSHLQQVYSEQTSVRFFLHSYFEVDDVAGNQQLQHSQVMQEGKSDDAGVSCVRLRPRHVRGVYTCVREHAPVLTCLSVKTLTGYFRFFFI